jgi:hypothetical protein
MNAFNHLMEIYQSGVKDQVFRKDKPEIMARSIWSTSGWTVSKLTE